MMKKEQIGMETTAQPEASSSNTGKAHSPGVLVFESETPYSLDHLRHVLRGITDAFRQIIELDCPVCGASLDQVKEWGFFPEVPSKHLRP